MRQFEGKRAFILISRLKPCASPEGSRCPRSDSRNNSLRRHHNSRRCMSGIRTERIDIRRAAITPDSRPHKPPIQSSIRWPCKFFLGNLRRRQSGSKVPLPRGNPSIPTEIVLVLHFPTLHLCPTSLDLSRPFPSPKCPTNPNLRSISTNWKRESRRSRRKPRTECTI